MTSQPTCLARDATARLAALGPSSGVSRRAGVPEPMARRGGFIHDARTGELVYHLDGQPLPLAPGPWASVPLAPERWLVFQPATSAAHAACEVALCLAWGMTLDDATDGLQTDTKTLAAVRGSLARRSGVYPRTISYEVTSPAGLRRFVTETARHLASHGPVLLDRNGQAAVLHELRFDDRTGMGSGLIADPSDGGFGEVTFGPRHSTLWAPPGTGPTWCGIVTVLYLPNSPLNERLRELRRRFARWSGPTLAAYLVRGCARDLGRLRAAPRLFSACCAALAEALTSERVNAELRGRFLRVAYRVDRMLASRLGSNGLQAGWRRLVMVVAYHYCALDREHLGDLGITSPAEREYLKGSLLAQRAVRRQGQGVLLG